MKRIVVRILVVAAFALAIPCVAFVLFLATNFWQSPDSVPVVTYTDADFAWSPAWVPGPERVARIAALQEQLAAGEIEPIRRDADAGDPDAEAAYAVALCRSGETADATAWFTRAAEHGQLVAMLELVAINRPTDRSVDLGPAATWSGRARTFPNYLRNIYRPFMTYACVPPEQLRFAERFLETALFADGGNLWVLGSWFADGGRGLTRDPIEAYALALVARPRVDSSNREMAAYVRELTVRLEAELSSADRRLGRARAREWEQL